MPVTIRIADHNANPLSGASSFDDVEHLFKTCCKDQVSSYDKMLQHSFGDKKSIESLIWKPNKLGDIEIGFVWAVLEAYNRHHHLVIRPDDIWIAILTQFNFYVNGNSEALRNLFVDHEGKKELTISVLGDMSTVDFGALARQMAKLLSDNLRHGDVEEWVLPQFSTTTEIDYAVFAIQMMATFKEYFNYNFRMMCGIPSITLLGTKQDWESILNRVGKLHHFGPETAHWGNILQPIITRFVEAFDGANDREFWGRIAHYSWGGSQPSYLSGWITAFCPWTKKGQWIDTSCLPANPIGPVPVMPITERSINVQEEHRHWGQRELANFKLMIDGQKYPIVYGLPTSYCEVDVNIDDNGKKIKGVMIAGHLGTRASSKENNNVLDTLQPVSGWMLYSKKEW